MNPFLQIQFGETGFVGKMADFMGKMAGFIDKMARLQGKITSFLR